MNLRLPAFLFLVLLGGTARAADADSAATDSAGPALSASRAPREPEVYEINELVVKGKRRQNEVDKLRTSGFAVNAVDLTRYQNTTEDINSVLSRTAGVKVRQSAGMGSSSQFSVNGMSGKQVRYFIDGVPLDVFGSSTTLSDIPVNLAERVEVYKGVVPISLGSDALGGAVNIISNNRLKRYMDASYSYGSFNTHRAALSGQYASDSSNIVVRVNAYHNSSDNNYLMRDVEVWDSVKYDYVETNRKRFHDKYSSSAVRVEAGIIDQPWADALFLGGSIGRMRKDIQTGFRQNIVYGEVGEESDNRNLMLTYRKNGLAVEGLDLNLFASLADDHSVVHDTAKKKYEWDGTFSGRGFSEQGGTQTVNHIIRPSAFARANLNYRLAEDHSVNFNGTVNGIRDENYNARIESEDLTPGSLTKWILGAAYESEWFSKRLVAQAFAKSYSMHLKQEQYAASLHQADDPIVKQNKTTHYLGYGTALRHKLFPWTGVKASYERTYRLQEAEEMFGNGLEITGNPLLRPEYSDNFNLGAYQEYREDAHRVFLEASGFWRDSRDFIYIVPHESSGIQQYENKGSARITGLEAEAGYTYARLLNASFNLTKERAINTTKYTRPVIFGDTAQRKPDVTYGEQIPNRPLFFANFAVGAGLDNVAGEQDRLQLDWAAHYVQWYYLTWASFGDPRGKAFIPTQFIQSASLTYSLMDERFNLSVECNNLTDALAFDNFRMQKPGRSFAAKARYFFR
jgi:outer membrane receptor protein involved in Fe transport